MNKIFDTFRPTWLGTVSGYLMVQNPKELIYFLKNAFYAEEINRSIDPSNGDIANIILKIETSRFMVSQARGKYLDMRTAFYLYVADVDEMHKRALEYGAKVDFEPSDMPYEDRQSGVIDASGNYWWISKRLVAREYD